MGGKMRVLALETSCDDTCAAVLHDHGERVALLSDLVSSQSIHAEFEGVVPELASREHLRLLGPILRRALEVAGVGLRELDAVAVTSGPGLIGSLLVGVSLAKALAYALELPVIGINHLEAHLAAPLLETGEAALAPPLVGLVASGGHTELVEVREWGRWTLLGATRDDAAGEAFDKVAKLLGLGFPGGPALARAAAGGDPRAHAFPRAWLGIERGGLDLSFSGLKTAVKLFLDDVGWPEAPADPAARKRFLADVAASFQAAVVDVLAAKLWKAAERTEIRTLLAAGGVAANQALRRTLSLGAAERGLRLVLPSPKLCGDNAAMVGMAAIHHLRRGERSGYDLAAIPNLDDWDGHYVAATAEGAAGRRAKG
ncbi:MAG: tRNA (adenosine(37)-N6)-threonylcarbamoyltransferase complex transferase subunit TsaD [Candidatus Eisenbacteria bacterium]|nr:tRNA (adenosine(37)-N6)-threonylcarbamoyltransferase complex transferase subunit TsaD [Candidatus Eisenbacteria bacterium]